ncbi:hypothetical protein FSP39_006656 [Pinctada imbricata]|uniref:Uncharacterized protein n=1 Tax=Pinctada imbricata TaxID=66713 RepID=A0AA88YD96_PINIB|nr:hypothetical protein FSP39_006656 [Pinctada imbricata]
MVLLQVPTSVSEIYPVNITKTELSVSWEPPVNHTHTVDFLVSVSNVSIVGSSEYLVVGKRSVSAIVCSSQSSPRIDFRSNYNVMVKRRCTDIDPNKGFSIGTECEKAQLTTMGLIRFPDEEFLSPRISTPYIQLKDDKAKGEIDMSKEGKNFASTIFKNEHKTRKSETEGIQNQDKTGTKANKQKPPPYEKKRTPDMGLKPGAQEEQNVQMKRSSKFGDTLQLQRGETPTHDRQDCSEMAALGEDSVQQLYHNFTTTRIYTGISQRQKEDTCNEHIYANYT